MGLEPLGGGLGTPKTQSPLLRVRLDTNESVAVAKWVTRMLWPIKTLSWHHRFRKGVRTWISAQCSLQEPLDGGLDAPWEASPWLLAECCVDVTVVVTLWEVARYQWVNPIRTRQFWLLEQELRFRSFLAKSSYRKGLVCWCDRSMCCWYTWLLTQLATCWSRSWRQTASALSRSAFFTNYFFEFSPVWARGWVDQNRSCVPCGYDKEIQRKRSIRTPQSWMRSTGLSAAEVY